MQPPVRKHYEFMNRSVDVRHMCSQHVADKLKSKVMIDKLSVFESLNH